MKKVRFFVTVLFCITVILLWYARSQEAKEVKGIKVSNNESVTVKENVIFHFLDIGQGDATYIEFPNGTDMLIDCSKDARILAALGRVMKFGDNTIDYLIPTHPDMDHYGGCIDVMKRFHVNHIVYSGYEKDGSGLYDYFWDMMQKEIADGAKYTQQKERRTVVIASSTIDFLYPDHDMTIDSGIPGFATKDESNNTSIVMRMAYGGHSVLLTGDMGFDLENYILKAYSKDLDVDILKVGHHGSAGSTSDEFLKAVTPVDATISAGKGNSYGHPTLRVIRKLERAKARIWRTDEMGDITTVLDGSRYTMY